jgi:hypothetical protein
MKPRKLAAMTAALLWLLAGTASAAQTIEALPQPSGPVVLVVTGKISKSNSGGVARFDRQMLEALGTKRLKTSTAWTAGELEFEGILVRDLLHAVGAQGTTVVATALNDYAASIPIEEINRYSVMLALKMNGEYLKIRDKGPAWIVYPRDQHKELQDSLTDKKWVWQLHYLHIK